MVYKIPPGGGGKPYLASGLIVFWTIIEHDKQKIVCGSSPHCQSFKASELVQ